MDRIITNPIVKDKVTFIKTAKETAGALTWIQVELSPKGGSELHFHKTFTETFIVQEGSIELKIKEQTKVLQAGEALSVPPLVLHQFHNPNAYPVRFDVKIEPANTNFEEFLQIMYGLARDGQTNKKGIPLNVLNIGAISLLGETYPPRWSVLGILSRIFVRLGHYAERKGVLSKLRDKYVEF